MKEEEYLAELIGVILGDGHLHQKDNKIIIVGSLEDIHHHKYIASIIKILFNRNAKIRKRKDANAYYTQFSSKSVMDYLAKDLGLIRGKKTKARIPNLIKKNKRLQKYFLRGIFDTDGCIKFSKQKKNKHYYPRIQFCFRESVLSTEVKEIIEENEFRVSEWLDRRTRNNLHFYQISGVEQTNKWFKEIGSKNIVHTSKYLFWEKFGYYVPKSSLVDRMEALNLNIKQKSVRIA